MGEMAQLLLSHALPQQHRDRAIATLSKFGLRRVFDDDDAVSEEADDYARITKEHSDVASALSTLLDAQTMKQFGSAATQTTAAFSGELVGKLALMSSALCWLCGRVRKLISESGGGKMARLEGLVAESLEPFGERCLSWVRVELRCVAVRLLSKMLTMNYWMPEDSAIHKPQEFVITLNKLWVACEGQLSQALPPRLVRFLFVEMAHFVCTTIINLLPRTMRINHVGYKQLYKNTFSLQQSLTTITDASPAMEKCFDRAQKYLKLATKTPTDIRKIREHAEMDRIKYAAYDFSKQQYDAIATVAKLSNARKH